MKQKIIGLLASSLMLMNIPANAQSSQSQEVLEISANILAGCEFSVEPIIFGAVSVDYINLYNEYLFKSFNMYTQCSPETKYKITSNQKASIDIEGGMEFVYMKGTKEGNKDYLGFHIGRHKTNPEICSNELNSTKTGIVYSSYRAAFTQFSSHTASGQKDTLPMCVYLYLPTHTRGDRGYNKYIMPDVYSAIYTFILEF